MKKLIFLVLLGWSVSTPALDGVYFGGQFGHVGYPGDSALGFGVDLGLRPSSLFDVLLQFHHSSHDNDFKINYLSLGPELQLGPHYDFTFTLGAGPGFYFFNLANTTENKFGLYFSGGTDLWLEDQIRLGLVVRWNALFGSGIGDNPWTIMFRFGYLFELL